MSDPMHLDFDLQLTPDGDGYLTRVLTSPAGQAQGVFRAPWTMQDYTRFLQQIAPTDLTLSRHERMDTIKSFGGRLFDALFAGPILVCLERSLDAAQRQNCTLRIKLRLNESPALLDQPWEYLYHAPRNFFLSQSSTSSLVYYLELPIPAPSLAVTLPLRMLVLIAAPADLPALDVEREWTNLQQALSPLIERGLVIVDRLPISTTAALQGALRRQEYHVLHFIGHGAYDEQNQEGMIMLTGEDGQGRALAAEDLARLLHNERTLRLILLNACESARTSLHNPFAGVAHALVQQGAPAVVAMRYPVSDAAAITFSHEFYAALADGYTVDGAITEARVAIATRLGNGEWGAPQLIMHAADGMLWQLRDLQTTEAIDGAVISRELSALTELMHSTAVRDRVAAYHADFRAACQQITILSNYKDLHDLLHKLQYRCYNVIAQEARRFPADELALDNLLNYEVTLQDITEQLQRAITRARLPASETAWIADIVSAQQSLRQALDNMETEALRRVVWLLRRVLALQPSHINHRLNAAARALRLATIIQSLGAILAELRQLSREVEQITHFEAGVDALRRFDEQLYALIDEHDQWQEVQRMLGRIEDVLVYDTSELEFSWPDLQQRVTALCGLQQGEWVNLFMQDSEQLDKAILTRNPVRIRSYFQRYRQRAGNRFYQVDLQLKELCTELRKVGESLAAILRVLE
ncbi:MAG: CHAT domain-containing protein [Caldilineaceae bacterium]